MRKWKITQLFFYANNNSSHATSPHHGAGAGFCIEDSAVMATLLSDDRVRTAADIEAAFAAFDTNRRERCQWLVESSRHIGDVYEWRAPGIDGDLEKIEKDIVSRNSTIGDFDIEEGCLTALQQLERAINQPRL